MSGHHKTKAINFIKGSQIEEIFPTVKQYYTAITSLVLTNVQFGNVVADSAFIYTFIPTAYQRFV